MNPQSILYAINAIDAALLLVVGVAEATEELQKRRSVLQTLADEARDPTQEEWDDLDITLTQLRAQLHSSG